ncbi:hypothetical protein DRQ36_01375 [bacterium]|nr:MAG: hypothetical protein DRQ36_01375 [bacterium]
MKITKALFLVFLLLFIGCSKESTEPSGSNKIKIGVVVPYSGECAAFGTPSVRAIQLAVKEINDSGGIMGKDIELIIKDSRTDAYYGKTKAVELAEDEDVIAILGADNSDVSWAISDELDNLGVIQITGSSTASGLTHQDGCFRTVPYTAQEAQHIVSFIRSITNTMRILYVDDLYGEDLSEKVRQNFVNTGGVVQRMVAFESGKTSYSAEIDSIYTESPGTPQIFLIAYPQSGAQIIRDWKASGRPGVWYLSKDLKAPEFITNAFSENVEGLIGFGPHGLDTTYTLFQEAYIDYWGEDPYNYRCTEHWYDAMILLGYGILRANSLQPEIIADSILTVSFAPGSLVTVGEFARGKDILINGGEINFEGASGRVNFSAQGDVTGAYETWQIVGGEFVPYESRR